MANKKLQKENALLNIYIFLFMCSWLALCLSKILSAFLHINDLSNFLLYIFGSLEFLILLTYNYIKKHIFLFFTFSLCFLYTTYSFVTNKLVATNLFHTIFPANKFNIFLYMLLLIIVPHITIIYIIFVKNKQISIDSKYLEKQIFDYNLKQNKIIYIVSIITIFYISMLYIKMFYVYALNDIRNWLLYGIISMIPSILVTIKMLLLKYRIHKNYYGTTKEDFCEIASYVLNNIDDIDNNTKILSKEHIEAKIKEFNAEKEGRVYG